MTLENVPDAKQWGGVPLAVSAVGCKRTFGLGRILLSYMVASVP
jgi:hypothetical protein